MIDPIDHMKGGIAYAFATTNQKSSIIGSGIGQLTFVFRSRAHLCNHGLHDGHIPIKEAADHSRCHRDPKIGCEAKD
jgi:hypothetical protein